MRFKVRRSGAQYFFRIVASNGQKLCHSENYVNKADCLNAIRIIQGGAGSAPVDDETSESACTSQGLGDAEALGVSGPRS